MARIVILTGAGISAESGLRTFRAADGLWENHRIEDVATPEGFARDPELVLRFYNERRGRHQVLVVTQNVDALHERTGTRALIHMHGTLGGALCATCGHRWPAPAVMRVTAPCPACAARAARPDIVWFSEMPYRMEEIWTALRAADLFVSIGTSGNVYPAAGFVADARHTGVETLELNLEPSMGTRLFDAARHGPATQVVPAWVAEMLA